MASKNASNKTKMIGPLADARDNAISFAANMMYAYALDEALRLFEIAEKEYLEALEKEDAETILRKKQELDYCLSCLKFSSILSGANIDESVP